MKAKVKQMMAFGLVVLLLVQYLPFGMQTITGENTSDKSYEVQLILRGAENESGASVSVNLANGVRAGLVYNSGAKCYQAATVSENIVPAGYQTQIRLAGYQAVDEQVAYSKEGEVLRGSIDMAPYQYHSVSGNAVFRSQRKESAAANAQVFLSKEKDGPAVAAARTDQDGVYRFT